MVDDRYWRNRQWTNTKVKTVPSEYFRDHMLATFIVDHNGVSVRHQSCWRARLSTPLILAIWGLVG